MMTAKNATARCRLTSTNRAARTAAAASTRKSVPWLIRARFASKLAARSRWTHASWPNPTATTSRVTTSPAGRCRGRWTATIASSVHDQRAHHVLVEGADVGVATWLGGGNDFATCAPEMVRLSKDL